MPPVGGGGLGLVPDGAQLWASGSIPPLSRSAIHGARLFMVLDCSWLLLEIVDKSIGYSRRSWCSAIHGARLFTVVVVAMLASSHTMVVVGNR